MRPKRAEAEALLDQMEFGKYVLHENDCDVMATKAREQLELIHPGWVTGTCIMYGFTMTLEFVGHGILVVRCEEGDLYYDCTTQDGKDTRRYRFIGWARMWWKYATLGFFVLWKYVEWGDYTPAALFSRCKRLHPSYIYGKFFSKVRRKSFV